MPEGLFDDLVTQTNPPGRGAPNFMPDAYGVDPVRPVMALRRIEAGFDATDFADSAETAALWRRAREQARRAARLYAGGSRDLSHLPETIYALAEVMDLLDQVQQADDAAVRAVARIRRDVTRVSEQIARDLLDVLRRAGGPDEGPTRALATGMLNGLDDEGIGGLAQFGESTEGSRGGLVFDVDVFEQNLVDALGGASVGYAFAIAFQGQLVGAGRADGVARANVDPPQVAQSPSKEASVASVGKTITAIMILNLLEENNLTPEAQIAPFLPSNWTLGPGVAQLTFAQLLTHTSGLGQIQANNSYNALRAAMASDVNSPTSTTCEVFGQATVTVTPQGFCYRNANYGLMRVLTAGLMGFDIATLPTPIGEDLTAYAFFRNHAQALFDDLGVTLDCVSQDANPTTFYDFPGPLLPGSQESDRRLTCGGFGWHVSAIEIAAIMAGLRNSEILMSSSYREMMQDGFLGFNDPGDGFVFAEGPFGVYYMHGGDWFYDFGEVHTCAAAFPIQLEVGLIINSQTSGIPYQCIVLKEAFEAAWVAN